MTLSGPIRKTADARPHRNLVDPARHHTSLAKVVPDRIKDGAARAGERCAQGRRDWR